MIILKNKIMKIILNLLDCKYRNIEYFKKLSISFKTKNFLFFHLNICSLQNFFYKFHTLLNQLNINLNTIAITESRIKENVPFPINIQLLNYSIEQIPTEASARDALLVHQ